jgi:hypothetical protein
MSLGCRAASRRSGPARLALALALSIAAGAVHAAASKHLGVATCSSSVCHGRLTATAGGQSNVALNEYAVWLKEDRHSQAYVALARPEAQRIAAKLGLGSAASARECLDCHADNVGNSLRGPKFQLRDGIGCEVCHGGAENWIEPHSKKGATHADDVARGMYPSETALGRAELCLGCHAGTPDKFATHAMMAAGHPRLSFELESFTTLQPPHFRRDDPSYLKRKGSIGGATLWITGQMRAAVRQVALLQAWWNRNPGAFPELALYDCDSCHHARSPALWSRERVGPGIGIGTMRLQTGHLVILRAIAEALEGPSGAEALAQATQELVQAGQRDASAIRTAGERVVAFVNAHEAWTRRAFTSEEVGNLRRTLLRYAASDRTSDLVAAEQVAMGVEVLSYASKDQESHRSDIDKLFEAVPGEKSQKGFDPARFAAAARSVAGRF